MGTMDIVSSASEYGLLRVQPEGDTSVQGGTNVFGLYEKLAPLAVHLMTLVKPCRHAERHP